MKLHEAKWQIWNKVFTFFSYLISQSLYPKITISHVKIPKTVYMFFKTNAYKNHLVCIIEFPHDENDIISIYSNECVSVFNLSAHSEINKLNIFKPEYIFSFVCNYLYINYRSILAYKLEICKFK